MQSKEIEALTQLKNALLGINGALLKLGKEPRDATILLPDSDWTYLNNFLVSRISTSVSKFYQPINAYEFKLSGIRIKNNKEGQVASEA